MKVTMVEMELSGAERSFAEFRRKIREADLLSGTLQKLLQGLRFSGRLTVVVKDGAVLKCGYEEGYFTRRQDDWF